MILSDSRGGTVGARLSQYSRVSAAFFVAPESTMLIEDEDG